MTAFVSAFKERGRPRMLPDRIVRMFPGPKPSRTMIIPVLPPRCRKPAFRLPERYAPESKIPQHQSPAGMLKKSYPTKPATRKKGTR